MMANKYLAQAQSVQQRASSLLNRLDKVRQDSESQEWPHASLDNSVRLYVRTTGDALRALVIAAAEQVLLPSRVLHATPTPMHEQRLQRHFRQLASECKYTDEQVSSAVFAACDTQLKTAMHLTNHLEACIRGEQTISGRVIARGQLWDK
jgi:hypothetical protein